MNADPQPQTTAPWRSLQEDLAGSFTARARSLLGNEFVLLDGDGRARGRLKARGLRGAELVAGDLRVTIERTADARYEMLSGDEEVLRAQPSAASELEIRCGERAYTAAISLFRNRAVVRDESGAEAVRLAGNATGRTYRVETGVEDPCALPVAVLLTYHTALHRRRAYRAAGG